MPGYTLNDKHLNALLEVVEACQLHRPAEALSGELLDSVSRLMGCDELVFIGLDYGVGSYYLAQSSRDPQQAFRSLFEVRPVDALFWRHFQSSTHRAPWIPDEMASVTKPTDFMSTRQWRTLPLYVDCFREGPTTSHELMMCLPDGFHRQLRLLCWRHTGKEFTDRERFDLQLLLPHIEAAYRRGERQRLVAPLTQRQRQLMEWVSEGYTNQQIARRMGLAEGTVRTHLNNIYARLGVSSRTEAVHQVLTAAGTLSPTQRMQPTAAPDRR
jgi:DNA-binding CsgD family transcriptional regulator